MKKLLRWIARVALGLLALQAIFYAVLVAANGHDDPLTPEAAHLLAPPTPPASDAPNAYYVLLGLDAPDDEDVAVAGRRIRDERDRLFLRNPHNPHYPYKLFDPMGSIYWEKLRCSLKKGEDCVDFYLGEKVHMQQVMAQQPVLQQRYQQFSQIPVFDEPPVRSEFEPVPPYSALTLAAEMRLMAAVFALDKGDLQTGADILMQEIRVHRRLLANSTQLTTKMVSVGLLRLDYAVLSDALEHWPLLARQAALTEAWQPLREQEYDMREVVESEAIFQANLMYWAVKLQFVIQRPLSLPNATINTYTRWTNENAQDFEGDATTIDTRRQAYITRQVKEKEQIAASYTPLGFIRNPVGKEILLLSGKSEIDDTYISLGFSRYRAGKEILLPADIVSENDLDLFVDIEYIHDLDGYIRLVALQAALRRDGVPLAQVADYVRRVGPNLRNPYDGQSMHWDAAHSTLSFKGRLANSYEEAASITSAKTYSVRLKFGIAKEN